MTILGILLIHVTFYHTLFIPCGVGENVGLWVGRRVGASVGATWGRKYCIEALSACSQAPEEEEVQSYPR